MNYESDISYNNIKHFIFNIFLIYCAWWQILNSILLNKLLLHLLEKLQVSIIFICEVKQRKLQWVLRGIVMETGTKIIFYHFKLVFTCSPYIHISYTVKLRNKLRDSLFWISNLSDFKTLYSLKYILQFLSLILMKDKFCLRIDGSITKLYGEIFNQNGGKKIILLKSNDTDLGTIG